MTEETLETEFKNIKDISLNRINSLIKESQDESAFRKVSTSKKRN